MHSHEMFIQDAATGRVGTVLKAIVGAAKPTAFSQARVSVAFASLKGCHELHKNLSSSSSFWPEAKKRWLVSIDFGQTSPEALTHLAGLKNSGVRIADGLVLLENNLVPLRSFHPKTYVFTQIKVGIVPDIGIVSGSANLTFSALKTNAEHVWAIRRWGESLDSDKPVLTALKSFDEWWDAAWSSATPYSEKFIERYKKLYKPEKQQQHDSEELSKVFANTKDTEIELHQLDCRRGTRVFFGFSSASAPPNTVLGQVEIAYTGKQPQSRSVKFGDNSMDKVNLPVPGDFGPRSYDGYVLHFERIAPKRFRLTMRKPAAAKEWVQKSEAMGISRKLGTSGRRFGFYT